MNKHHLERFSFLSDKFNSDRATPREIKEYYMLLDEWNNYRKNDIIDAYMLNSPKSNFDGKQ